MASLSSSHTLSFAVYPTTPVTPQYGQTHASPIRNSVTSISLLHFQQVLCLLPALTTAARLTAANCSSTIDKANLRASTPSRSRLLLDPNMTPSSRPACIGTSRRFELLDRTYYQEFILLSSLAT